MFRNWFRPKKTSARSDPRFEFRASCCFCGSEVASKDPCRLELAKDSSSYQLFFCHGECLRQQLAPQFASLLEPAFLQSES